MNVHRFAIAVAATQLIAIVSGAYITSSRIALGPGLARWVSAAHAGIGIAVLALALGLCLAAPRVAAASIGFASLVLAVVVSGWPVLRVVWHAVFAHSSVALTTAVAVVTSSAWIKPAERVELGSWSALRPAAIATPPAVLVQISLGALYRHQVIGVMPHMLGAMVVALLTLVVSVVLLQHFTACRPLQSAATALISIVLAQVCLGIAVFIMVLLDAGNTPAFAWTATAHVSVGSVTLAASVVTAILVARLCVGDTPADRNTQSSGPST